LCARTNARLFQAAIITGGWQIGSLPLRGMLQKKLSSITKQVEELFL